MKKIKILSMLVLSLTMLTGIMTTTNIYVATDPSAAPSDWAFSADSVPLHDAILVKYPAIDTNVDGYISKTEASSWTGTTISLNNQGITGTLSGIENFINITILQLHTNQLEGSIPLNIGNMTNLVSLYLHTNQLSGTIPASITSLSNLNLLYLSVNQLSGSIPSDIGDLNATKIYIQDNQLSGSIPTSIGSNTNLTHLNLARNNFTGNIPSEIGNLTNLVQLSLAGNNLDGDLPESIYDLPVLNYLNVSENTNLTGNPVEGFKDHNNLQNLYVNETNLIQAKPDIPSLVTFVNDNLAEQLLNTAQDGPVDGLTQEQINKAQ
ncbi:MAG: hypothetical protein ACK5LC_03285, partial [Coprobacillaceae bacterium]